MANVRFFDTVLDDPFGDRSFDGLFSRSEAGPAIVNTETEVVFVDGFSGHRLHFAGDDLVFDGTKFTSGTIDKVFISNAEDASFVSVTKFNVDAQTLYQHYTDDDSLGDMFKGQILTGADKVVAPSQNYSTLESGAGNDKLIGSDFSTQFEPGKGNDKLTFGAQHDTVDYMKGDGKDVFNDFDAKGKVHDFLYLDQYTNNHVTLTALHHGHDTLMDFGGHDKTDSILFVGVKMGDLNAEIDYDYF